MSVYTTHHEYEKALSTWTKCSDFVAGSEAVKAKREMYLPRPNPDDTTPEANQRYQNYLDRAVFYELSADTVDKYLGLVFKQDPTFEVDERLAYLKKNADGGGVSIYQQAQNGFKKLMVNARFGLFVDMPNFGDNISQADIERQNIRPKILFYTAENIINWHIAERNNLMTTVLIVLREYVQEQKTEFEFKTIEQYRYLGLDEIGFFVEVYRKNDDGKSYLHAERVYPKANGQYWQTIPFQIFGSQFNTWQIQKAPIEPLVNIEKGIYCNSADAENSRFLCGQVQPFANLGQMAFDYYTQPKYDEQGNKIPPPKFKLGSETILMLGENGIFGFAQAQSNTMATEGIKEKREIIHDLGLQLGQAGSAVKTATQAEHDAHAQYSKASLCVANLNEGFENVLAWCSAYLGITSTAKFKIRQNFIEPTIDVNILNTLSALVDGGKIPKSALYERARAMGLISAELSDDDIDGMIEADNPTLDLD